MKKIQELRARARTVRPWRNGGGVTRDIVQFPAEAGDETFVWRASVATIGAAGPFSAWPGLDRTLMLLSGQLVIAIDGAAERCLGRGDAAIAFAGEAAVAARPIGGECTVFNIMVRRGRAKARLERWTAARDTDANQVLLVAEVATTIRFPDRSINLDKHDALLLGHAEVAALESNRPVIVAEMLGR